MALPLQIAGERIGVQVLRAGPGRGFLVPGRLDVFLHQAKSFYELAQLFLIRASRPASHLT